MSDNRIYVNNTVSNTGNKPMDVVFSSIFDNPYLSCPSNYYLAVIRFDLPNSSPILYFQDNYYKVSLTYQNTNYETFVTYIDRSGNSDYSKPINSFQHMLQMINAALLTSFNSLKAANPGLNTITESPYLTYDPSSKLFSLFVQKSYSNVVNVSINKALNNLFKNSFDQSISSTHPGFLTFNIEDYNNNTYDADPTFYKISQEVSTLYEWYEIERILFSTGSIPVKTEYISTSLQDGSSISEKIITDFLPQISDDKSNFIYLASPYRVIEMMGNSPLNTVDISVRYITNTGELKPYRINPGEKATCKLGFFKKDSYFA